ncbi:MAG: hypothetical protein K1X94_07175 [Sandaracinaceae bacterium]|jgi:hypothetical protein|nr:hypothetical protein [Sandaracinaceae bacterium]
MRRALLTTTLALGLAGVPACSPNAPTDGFYGCATGSCPSQFPYCDPVELRCYAEVPIDGGPRPDAWHPGGTVGMYGTCTSNDDCQSQLTCLGGACVTGCTPSGAGGGGCAGSGLVCAPVHAQTPMTSPFGCVPGVGCGMGCITPLHSRQDPMSHFCQCVPSAWD